MAITVLEDGGPGGMKVQTLDADIAEVASGDAMFVGDLQNVTLHVTCADTPASFTCQPQYSHDGSNWVDLGAAIDNTDTFPMAVPLETSNGMSVHTQYVRLDVSAHAAGADALNVVVGGLTRK